MISYHPPLPTSFFEILDQIFNAILRTQILDSEELASHTRIQCNG